MMTKRYGHIGIPEEQLLNAAKMMQYDDALHHKGVAQELKVYERLLDRGLQELFPGDEPMHVTDFKISIK